MRSLYLLGLLSSLPAAPAAAFPLTAPCLTGEWKTLPRWQNGYLSCFRLETWTNDPSPNLLLLDSSGKTALRSRLWIRDAVKVEIHDVYTSRSGNGIAGGYAYSPAGQIAGFLAFFSPRGTVDRIVQTGRLAVSRIGVDTGGRIWALGHVPPADGTAELEHKIVQIYTPGGTLWKEALPRSSFRTELSAHLALGALEGFPQWVPLPDGMGLLITASQEWLEFDGNGDLRKRVRAPFPGGCSLRGALVVSDGMVHANFSCLGLARLNRETGAWLAATPSEKSYLVLGSESSDVLVVRSSQARHVERIPGFYSRP